MYGKLTKHYGTSACFMALLPFSTAMLVYRMVHVFIHVSYGFLMAEWKQSATTKLKFKETYVYVIIFSWLFIINDYVCRCVYIYIYILCYSYVLLYVDVYMYCIALLLQHWYMYGYISTWEDEKNYAVLWWNDWNSETTGT